MMAAPGPRLEKRPCTHASYTHCRKVSSTITVLGDNLLGTTRIRLTRFERGAKLLSAIERKQHG